jgi:hypothetical protein
VRASVVLDVSLQAFILCFRCAVVFKLYDYSKVALPPQKQALRSMFALSVGAWF